MAVTITKPTVGGSEDTWGATINTALDDIVAALNGTAGTIAPDMTGFDINGVPVTATAAELNILDGVTATAAELNVLDGITATVTELNYVDGVTSAIQTQIDGKQASDATLTALAGVLTAANKIPYATALDTAGELDFKDEDDMASDSATALASQQSIKAYIQSQIEAYCIGVNQTWQNVSRVKDTTYQNTTGRPIQVSIDDDGGDAYFQISTDGSTWSSLYRWAGGTGSYERNHLSVIIPDQLYYRVSGGNGVGNWWELR